MISNHSLLERIEKMQKIIERIKKYQDQLIMGIDLDEYQGYV